MVVIIDKTKAYPLLSSIYILFSSDIISFVKMRELAFQLQYMIDDTIKLYEKELERQQETNQYIFHYWRDTLDRVAKEAKKKITIIKRVKEYCDKSFYYLSKNYFYCTLPYLRSIKNMMYTLLEKENML